MKFEIKGPSKQELTKLLTAAAAKQIADTARRAEAPHGGVRLRFKHKADGSLATVGFEGSGKAVQAARDSLEN